MMVCEVDEDDLQLKDGWCITCKHNLGPNLPGGTLNEAEGCTCNNRAHLEEMSKTCEGYVDDDGKIVLPANLYRGEVLYDEFECDHWEKGEETPKLYGIE